MRCDKSTSNLCLTLQQGAIASGALCKYFLCIVGAYLVRRQAFCFYIKSGRFDVGQHFFFFLVIDVGSGGDTFLYKTSPEVSHVTMKCTVEVVYSIDLS
jgi:hypothetical protein